MPPVSETKKPRSRPRGLTSTEEKILRAFGELLPFARAIDITRLLFKKGSLSYVRHIMTGLAGGADYHHTQYLCRFGMPNAPGNFERIYTLGRRGRDFLQQLGVQVDWWYRPQKASNHSFSFLMHHLSVTKFLVALHAFCRDYLAYQVREIRTGFALASNPPSVTFAASGQETTIVVIPDAWVHIERSEADTSERQNIHLWIEIDHGTESKSKFQQLVRNRINFIRYEAYEAYFGTPSILCCYLAVGTTTDYRLGRLHKIRKWTAGVLSEQKLDDWASVFRFSTIDECLYDTLMHFTDPVWYRPDSDTLVPLFTTPQEQEETDGHSTTTPHC